MTIVQLCSKGDFRSTEYYDIQFVLHAVLATEHRMAKSFASCSVRKQPETFIRIFIILRSRSALLFVNGTERLRRNRRVAFFLSCNPKA